MMGGTKEEHDGRERKSKAWYAKSRDPQYHLNFYERGRYVE